MTQPFYPIRWANSRPPKCQPRRREHCSCERRSVIGTAAARILRKASGPAGAGQIPKGAGSPLPADIKAKMEPKLDADLSGVRLHTGSDSAQAATNFGARAFTVGNDIHFDAGQYSPGSKEGDKLLAHELTHVVQGNKSGVQRKTDDGDESRAHEKGSAGAVDVSHPEEPAEKEADAVSDEVADKLHSDNRDRHETSDGAKPDSKPAAISAKLNSTTVLI